MRRRDIWIILAVLTAVSCSAACGGSYQAGGAGSAAESRSGERDSYTTDSRSTDFESRDEKLDFLRKYLEMPSEVTDAAYHIVYQDNSQGAVPGPSDWEISVALQVNEGAIPLWTEGMKKILPQQVDNGWWEELKTPSFTWEIPGDAVYYKRPGSQSYLVVCPGTDIILKFFSTTYIPPALVTSDPQEAFPGHEAAKAAAAEALGYDESTIPFIETAQVMNTRNTEGQEVELICLRAMYFDSPIYGIPVLAVSLDGNIHIRVLCDGSYEDEFFLADITGDGVDELLANHCTGVTGGAGSYQSAVYQLGGKYTLKTLFENPDSKTGNTFDSLFGLHMAEDYVCTVVNGYTGSETVFTHNDLKDSPYYDKEGNLTDKGRERNQADLLEADPFFFMFRPVDTDGDGIYEIMTAQYSYLWGRSDSLGSACTILRWSDISPHLYIAQSKFLANGEEGEGDGPGYDWYEEEPQDTEDSRNSEEVRRLVCETIENMDFTPIEYPLESSFHGSETDRRYREVFYQVVTSQRPVLCRKYRSLEYEEVNYPQILNMDWMDEKLFQSQVLEQISRYYYMDYDGDGLPEMMVRHMGIYGFKYIPEEDQVYLFHDYAPSSYVDLMGAGQMYFHNPCLANKDMYSYSYEDRNGNYEFAGFETISQWYGDRNEYKEYYYVSADGYRDVEVSGKVYDRLIGRLWDAYENAPVPMNFEEFFGK